MSGSSRQLTIKKGAPGDQVPDLLCVQLASYLERAPLMWMMPLHLHVYQKSDYDYDDMMLLFFQTKLQEKNKEISNKVMELNSKIKLLEEELRKKLRTPTPPPTPPPPPEPGKEQNVPLLQIFGTYR